MIQPNLLVIFLAALIPLVVGFIWYNSKVFGAAWMKAAEINEEKMKGAKMPLIFGLTYVLSFFAAFMMMPVTIHQFSLMSIVMNEPGIQPFDPTSEAGKMVSDFMAKYGTNFRTFKHGALHGTIAGVMLALPVIGVNALFERKGFKYVAINAGFWIVCLALMGGVVCAFS
ncbi:MAG TPA: DUF1761 domain-containing protein [Bacteroidia bacterium]|nr:DUF1761 domain-containing protein [Bacteroidia bacterium]